MDFFTLDGIDVKNKTVVLRVDINVPYDLATRSIQDSARLREHSKTIKELSDKGAKVVVLAHQGRRGDTDFIHLDQHAELLSKHIGKKVEFVEDVIGEKATEGIKSLKPENVLLLDNVRFLDEETEEKLPEEHAKGRLVQTLAPLADIFVNDAFSASHRGHASITGFAAVLLPVAGRVMEKEIVSCEKLLKPKRPIVYVLGGAKPEEPIGIMKRMLKEEKIDKALTCGVLGEMFLMARGVELGDATRGFLEKKNFLGSTAELKILVEKYGKKIEIPIDVAIEENGKRKDISVQELPADNQILDIGVETAKKYANEIKKAKTIVVKGPAGVYEKPGFETGTKTILEAIAESKAFSLIGGGDSSVAVEKLGIDKTKFSYISLGGGALITYLSGKPMPGIECLKRKKTL